MALKYVINPEDLPKHLYKFRIIEDPHHKRMLMHNELFFTSPKQFNDPFDSTIPVRYDEGTREEIVNYWAEHLSITRPELSQEERERDATELYESGRFRSPQSIEKIEEIITDRVYKDIGVFSLSGHYENILLWSHYADKHKGFCVEFDARRLYLFCIKYLKDLESQSRRGFQSIIFRNVTYAEKYPVLNAYRIELAERTLTQLLTKSNDWWYEQEYRIVWFHGADKKLIIDDGIISKVILGCQMFGPDREEIISILKSRSDRIPLLRAKKKLDSFGLDFEYLNY
jgi:hypothetical protein